MYNFNSALTIVKKSVTLIGFDYINNDFTLFNDDDEKSVLYKNTLIECVKLVFQDLYDNTEEQEQRLVELPLFIEDSIGLFHYSYELLPIFRILNIYTPDNELLMSTYKLEEVINSDNKYILQPFSILVKTKYDFLKVFYIPNDVYINYDLAIPEGRRSRMLISDNDIILIESDLIIYKLSVMLLSLKGLNTQIHQAWYDEKLNYYKSREATKSQPNTNPYKVKEWRN